MIHSGPGPHICNSFVYYLLLIHTYIATAAIEPLDKRGTSKHDTKSVSFGWRRFGVFVKSNKALCVTTWHFSYYQCAAKHSGCVCCDMRQKLGTAGDVRLRVMYKVWWNEIYYTCIMSSLNAGNFQLNWTNYVFLLVQNDPLIFFTITKITLEPG